MQQRCANSPSHCVTSQPLDEFSTTGLDRAGPLKGTAVAFRMNTIDAGIRSLLLPRLIACVSGHYPDGSSHTLTREAACNVIRMTQTRACVFRTPAGAHSLPREYIDLQALLGAFKDIRLIVPIVNTTGATNPEEGRALVENGILILEAQVTASFAFPLLVKLEILTPALTADNRATLECLALLPSVVRTRTIPLVGPEADVVSHIVAFGCPAIRVVYGRLRHPTAQIQEKAIRNAIRAAGGSPVILEGGISSASDVYQAAALGASAVLVNSAFKRARDPSRKAMELRRAADEAWGGSGGE